MAHDNSLIDLYIDLTFIPQVETLKMCLLEKVLPSFDDFELEKETGKKVEEGLERLSKSPFASMIDPADLEIRAHEMGIDYYIIISKMRYGIIGLFVVGLYHLFEQQLLVFYKRVILNPYERSKEKSSKYIIKWHDIKKNYKEKGIDLESLSSYSQINTLRLAGNVIKHAEGASAEKLRKRKPEYFMPLDVPEIVKPIKGTERSPALPLAGEDLKIPLDDFIEYCDAVIKFWNELQERMKET